MDVHKASSVQIVLDPFSDPFARGHAACPHQRVFNLLGLQITERRNLLDAAEEVGLCDRAFGILYGNRMIVEPITQRGGALGRKEVGC